MSRLPLPGPGSIVGGSQHGSIASQGTRGPPAQSGASPTSPQDLSLRDLLERWAGSDDTLRAVMHAKAEEDRLRQEVLRLEIRRQEQDMFREIVRSGCPPHLIPAMFAGGASAMALATATAGPQQGSAATSGGQASSMPAPPPAGPSHMLAPSQMPLASPRQPFGGGGGGPPSSPGPAPSRPVYAVGAIPPYRPHAAPGTSPQHVQKSESGLSYGERSSAYSQPRIGLGILPMPEAPLPRGQTYSTQLSPGAHGQAQPPPPPPPQQMQQPSPAVTATPQQPQRESRDQSQQLFFHHWQPPASAADKDDESSARLNSPTPKKRRTAAGSGGGGSISSAAAMTGGQLVPTSQLNPSSSRRSPVRGHSRHRSEASVIGGGPGGGSRYQDPVSWSTGPASPAATFTQSRAREAPFTPSSSSMQATSGHGRGSAESGRIPSYEMRDRDDRERERGRDSIRRGGSGGSGETGGPPVGRPAELLSRPRARAQSGSTIPEEAEISPVASQRSRD